MANKQQAFTVILAAAAMAALPLAAKAQEVLPTTVGTLFINNGAIHKPGDAKHIDATTEKTLKDLPVVYEDAKAAQPAQPAATAVKAPAKDAPAASRLAAS